ncbi:MAG: GNAT family N-acetyltransferase [Bacteroidetes bacterium]|jgi:ribosomal protein S18 acetylase RimI-like enzyme|nr:GNAT family N-acetyltransferase [Bacteroidota bacterium]
MVTIHLVRPSEVEELLSLSRKTFYDAFEHLNNKDDFEAYTAVAFASQKLLSELENLHSQFYFALIDDEKVGYIKLNYASAQTELQDDNAIEVERIYVLASQQGKKIGNQLLDFAIDKAKAENKNFIWLGVWEHNMAAQRFYERNGFKAFGSHKFWVGKDEQTDILMRKEL